MSKFAIISQPEQGVLIDIGGCTDAHEATQHLSSTLQAQSQFWENQSVDLNLGTLALNQNDLAQVLAIFSEVGVKPRNYFAQSEETRTSLEANNIKVAGETPAFPGAENNTESAKSEATGETETAAVGSEAASSETTAAAEGDTTENKTDEQKSDKKFCTECGAEQPEEAKEEPKPAAPTVPQTLLLRQTLRSGQTISHKGHLVIIGDVNPGAEVMAEGDITIWGALRGVAHAGTNGNTNAEIRALKFEPVQLRIAHAIARSPDRKPGTQKFNAPETARVVNGTIRISSSAPQ